MKWRYFQQHYIEESSKSRESRSRGLDGVLEEIRSIKTPEEIHSLRCACNIACRAFDYLLDDIRIGVTEKSWKQNFRII